MKTKATLRYLRVSPSKARLVIDQIRGKNANDAIRILTMSRKAVARPILKLLQSAIANAQNHDIEDIDALKVSKATVDQGPTLKRWRPMPMGRAGRILKRTSIISLELD